MDFAGRTLSLTTTGAITISQSEITLGMGNLTLTASAGGITFNNAAGLTITAGDVTLTGAISSTNRALTVTAGTATGVIALNGNINTGTGDITLTAPGATGITLGSNTTLTGGAVSLTGAVNGASGNRDLSVNARDDITLGGSIALGGGALNLRADEDENDTGAIMNNGTVRQITVGALSLRQAGEFGDIFTADSTASGAVTLRVLTAEDQTIHPWMAGLGVGEFLLTGGGGAVLTSITTGTTALEFGGAVDLRATTITFAASLTAAGNVSLRADTIEGDGNNLVFIHATTGDITATDITDTSAPGTGRPALADSVTGFNLRQDSAFERGILPFTFVDENITATITLSTSAAQEYRGWMDFPGRTLSLTTTGALTISQSEITIGTGDLTLVADGGITLTNTAGLTIRAGVVVVTGAISAADLPLTIRALGNLTVGSITLGTGALNLLAGLTPGTAAGETGAVIFVGDDPAVNPTITAGSISLAQDEQFVDTAPATFQDNTDTAIPVAEIEGIYFAGADSATPQEWLTVTGVDNLDINLGDGNGNVTIEETAAGETILNAVGFISLNAGSGFAIIFEGTGPITITAPMITIIAGTIDIGERSLTITAETGALTLNVGTITGTGMASLSLSGNTIVSSGAVPTLNVPTVSLELTGAGNSFGSTAPFAASQIGTLTITTQAAQQYRGWMAAAGRNLTIDSQGAITINSTAINLGTGNLTLRSNLSISLTNLAGLTITAGDVTFFATLLSDNDIGVSQLVVMASGDIEIINIVLPGGRIELRADSGTITFNPEIVSLAGLGGINAGVLFLQHSVAFAEDLFDATTGVNVSGVVNLRITGAGVDQTIHPWMTNLGGSTFRLRGEGVVLNSITTEAALDLGATALDLRATSITLGGALTGATVSLRADMITGDSANLVAITATTGNITATGASGTGLPALADDMTTGVTAFSLTQNGAFGELPSLPFTFEAATITAITLSTSSTQAYRGWMDFAGRTLSLTTTGAITISQPAIALGMGNLTLVAPDGITFSAAGLMITAADVSLMGALSSANRALAITATTITLNNDINTGTGNITLTTTGPTGITLGGDIVLTGGAVSLTGVVSGASGNRGLRVNANDTITLGGDIDLGMGELSLRAGEDGTGNIRNSDSMTLRVITVGGLFLRQRNAFGDDLFDPDNSAATGEVRLRIQRAVPQDVHAWMTNLGDGNFSLHGSGAVLTSITTAEALERIAGTVSLRATAINLGGALTGTAVALRANTIAGDDNALVAIHASSGDIAATGANGTGRPALAGSVTSFSLTRTATFELDTLPFTFVRANIAAVTLDTRSAQRYFGWMRGNGSANLDLTSTGAITITPSRIDLSGGDFTLDGASIVFTNARGLTINAGAVSLTGSVSAASRPLTIEAQGAITVGNINLGTGALDLQAGLASDATAAISFAASSTITAGSVRLAQDVQFAGTTAPATFQDSTGTAILPADIEGVYLGAGAATTRAWLTVQAFQGVNYAPTPDGTGDIVVPQATSTALESITLNAGAGGVITFGGTGAITLTAPQITITAMRLIIGANRALTINAAGGTITLNVGTLSGTSAAASVGDLTLNAATIVSTAVRTFLVATLNLTQTGEFVAEPFPFDTGVGAFTLNLSTQAADQRYRGWMSGAGRTVSLTAAGVITVGPGTINLGTGDLTLDGTAIRITNTRGLTITAGAVEFTGFLTSPGLPLSVVATGDITLNSNINLGITGALDLRAGVGDTTGNILNGGSSRQIIAGSLHLQSDGAFANALFATSSRVAGAVEIRYGTGLVSSAFEPWVLSLGQGDLSVRAIDSVTPLTTLLVDGDIGSITRTEGVVDIRWLTLSFSNDSFIQARAITLHADALTGTALSLMATNGDIDLRAANGTANSVPGGSSFTSITLRQNSAFGSSAPFTFTAANVTELTLRTEAAQTLQDWMTASGRSLNVRTSDVLTIVGDIDIGAADLTLRGDDGITLGGTGTITTLTAENITLRGVIDTSASPRDLTIDATGVITLLSDINLGTGDLSIESTFSGSGAPIVIGGLTSDLVTITFSGSNVTLANTSAGGVSTGSFNNSLTVNALDNITLNAAISLLNMVRLSADENNDATGTIMHDGTARRIQVSSLFLRQSEAAFASTLFTEDSTVSGAVSLRLRTAADQVIHPWIANLGGDGNFSVHGAGVTLTSITLSTALTRSAGVIDLRATTITLGGALTGTSVALRTNNLAGDGTNPLVIHATTGDITATRINATSGAMASGLPTLSATPSFSLEQTSAFGTLDTLPFAFVAAEITGAITISTRSEQIVRGWMIATDRDLTITSSANVRVETAIGSGGRNPGNGNLTLTSTGAGTLRILAGITTGGDLTLSGGTGGINFNGGVGAKTISGAIVTLSGDARSNRALTITATAGALTLGGDIFADTSNLTLGATGGDIVLGGDVELRGGVIRLNAAIDGTTMMGGNHGLRVFANGNIFLGGVIALGSGALLLSADQDNNRTGNISNPGGTAIMVGALTLRQVSAFGANLFDPDTSTASGAVILRLRSAAIQPIEPWMTGLGTGDFSLRGIGGIMLTAINTTAALDFGGVVDLRATTINLGGDVTGRGITGGNGITLIANTINLTAATTLTVATGGISITGAVNGSAGDHNLAVSSQENLTINDNINLGTGDLTITGLGRIIPADDVILTVGTYFSNNAIDGSAAGADFTINASENLTLSNVNLGTGNLVLNNTSMNATSLAGPPLGLPGILP